MLVTATYSQQMTEVISSTSSFDQLKLLIEDGACCIFGGENRQLKFHRTPYPNYHFKEQKCFFFCHNNYHCIRKKFRTILHWHWHAFSWPLASASNDGKIINKNNNFYLVRENSRGIAVFTSLAVCWLLSPAFARRVKPPLDRLFSSTDS